MNGGFLRNRRYYNISMPIYSFKILRASELSSCGQPAGHGKTVRHRDL